MSSRPEDAWLAALAEAIVVVDLDGPYLAFGRLVAWSDGHLELAEADLHDCREGSSTREVYCLETKRIGVRSNRTRVSLPRARVIAVSRLDEVQG
jgi:hypothetical protein